MRVLFVNVIDPHVPTQKLFYPLSFGYLVSYAEKHGWTFKFRYTESISSTLLRDFNPDIVALTSITENYDRACKIASFVKHFSPKAKVVVGGIHISSAPQSLSSAMDIGVIGEGEQTFLELLQQSFKPSDDIKGLVYLKDSQPVLTAERDLIEPLDNIPHPRRDIFGMDPRQSYLFTSRGCSYRCIFCSSSRFWKKLRFHSAEYVAEEIRQLRGLGYKSIYIYDDCFPLDMNRAKKIRDLIKGLDVEFSLSVRANLVNDDMAQVLKDMNVTSVGMGLESNSASILEYLQKGNTPEDNQRAVDILKKHGFHVHCSFIRDIPNETKADLKATYDFIKRNKLSYDMYKLMRFPNTPIYEGSKNWEGCRVHYYQKPLVIRTLRHVLRKGRAFCKRRLGLG